MLKYINPQPFTKSIKVVEFYKVINNFRLHFFLSFVEKYKKLYFVCLSQSILEASRFLKGEFMEWSDEQ